MKKIQSLTMVKFFAAALVATFLFAGQANAQNDSAGKFTLPYEVRWGLAVLPAGEYQFSLNSVALSPVIAVWSTNLNTSAFVRPSLVIDQRDTKARSALTITIRGNQRTVRSLRLAELGVVLNFGSEKGRGHKTLEEARATQEVSVLVAKR